MKKYILIILSAVVLATTSCDDILDRPQLNTPTDGTFWKTEMDARLYANGFYRNYFVGYADGWTTNYAPLRGYSFSDDLASTGQQSSFSNSIPSAVQIQVIWLPIRPSTLVRLGILPGFVKRTFLWNVWKLI